jgi:hypothetical protein
VIITRSAFSPGPRIQSPFGDLLIRHCHSIREILDLQLKCVMFCSILLRSPTAMKFFVTLLLLKLFFFCKFRIVTDWYEVLPLTQDGNYGFMLCTTTLMRTCLPWALCSLFLMLRQNVNSKPCHKKSFFGSVSLLDSLLHFECNRMKERKTNK